MKIISLFVIPKWQLNHILCFSFTYEYLPATLALHINATTLIRTPCVRQLSFQSTGVASQSESVKQLKLNCNDLPAGVFAYSRRLDIMDLASN